MKKDIVNLGASVRALLQNKAKETNRPFAEVLQYYGIERFLYRFSQSEYADKFVLKGALLFTAWQIPERRTTLDIDFLARLNNQVENIETVMRSVCNLAVEPDGLVFNAKTVQGCKIKEGADYEGVRVKFLGFLERSRIPMQIDVGFGDIVYPMTKVIDYPVILDFPQPHLKGYPVESVISEKFEAMVKLGLLNSRMKDFYDIWLIMRQFDFSRVNLAEALKRTFEHRKTDLPKERPLFAEEIYDEKSDRQTLWKAFLRKGDIKHAPEKLAITAKGIEEFLIKPLDAINKGKGFNKEWKAPGPWKENLIEREKRSVRKTKYFWDLYDGFNGEQGQPKPMTKGELRKIKHYRDLGVNIDYCGNIKDKNGGFIFNIFIDGNGDKRSSRDVSNYINKYNLINKQNTISNKAGHGIECGIEDITNKIVSDIEKEKIRVDESKIRKDRAKEKYRGRDRDEGRGR